MICSGRAEILEEYADRVVCTVRKIYQMPAVIRLIGATKAFYKKGPRFNRNNIYLRDKGKCQYCTRKLSKSEFQLEHVTPRAQGGRTNWQNVVVACEPCNQRKQDKTPAQARMKLSTKPVQPRSLPGMVSPAFRWEPGMPMEWKSFVASVTYWHSELEND
jgi:5-methylcytosine-specific restriction endonuclease McrA